MEILYTIGHIMYLLWLVYATNVTVIQLFKKYCLGTVEYHSNVRGLNVFKNTTKYRIGFRWKAETNYAIYAINLNDSNRPEVLCELDQDEELVVEYINRALAYSFCAYNSIELYCCFTCFIRANGGLLYKIPWYFNDHRYFMIYEGKLITASDINQLTNYIDINLNPYQCNST